MQEILTRKLSEEILLYTEDRWKNSDAIAKEVGGERSYRVSFKLSRGKKAVMVAYVTVQDNTSDTKKVTNILKKRLPHLLSLHSIFQNPMLKISLCTTTFPIFYRFQNGLCKFLCSIVEIAVSEIFQEN